MPTLNWIGKDKVVNHHLDVPFRTLEKKYTYGEDEGNMIIHGDNLDALKALLPKYEGRVKCIYIDPPYNTGNEGWVYNDNVNDPKIRKWLGEVVGKEGEDLSRHDKWLCMMYPRLKLLHKLLVDDGVIFISIDDNELYNLKCICDEIFGTRNFVANVIWQKTYSPRNDSKGIPYETDNIVVYRKSDTWIPNKLNRTAEMDARHDNPDNDPIPWQSGDVSAAGSADHQGMVYAIQHPITGKLMYPAPGRHWKDEQRQVLSIMNEWASYELVDIHDEIERARICNLTASEVRQGVRAIMLNIPLANAKAIASERYLQGNWPAYYFTSKGKGGLRFKNHRKDDSGKTATNLWRYDDVGHTDEASKEIKQLFFGNAVFETPKPCRLIERIMQIATDPDSIILDSFAGSGTTAHAVLNMNKQDGGHRKFILVEMMDYADTITAERVKRVISGYGEGKKAVEGTGGGFSFYELGEPLLIDGLLNPEVPEQKIREYVYYTETRQPLPEASAEEKHLLGVHDRHAYYFYYEPKQLTTLNKAFLRTIKTPAESYLIYADVNTLSAEEMEKFHITFKKIPRDIALL
jgi:adenine-specific DNA-methyltransferase